MLVIEIFTREISSPYQEYEDKKYMFTQIRIIAI